VWVIVRQAFYGARRFQDFQRGIGLARNVLTERLNWLVDNGIFERRHYKTSMPAAPSRSSAAA
jgi:DNA-binding HxlR family transcriptional regulator